MSVLIILNVDGISGVKCVLKLVVGIFGLRKIAQMLLLLLISLVPGILKDLLDGVRKAKLVGNIILINHAAEFLVVDGMEVHNVKK